MQQRKRRVIGAFLVAIGVILMVFQHYATQPSASSTQSMPDNATSSTVPSDSAKLAVTALEQLEIKGRAPKTGYERVQFGDGWLLSGNCDTRNIILNRDLTNVTLTDTCKVASGVLADPYTGTVITFSRGKDTSSLVQIDHVVALSNAWQTGAQLLPFDRRVEFANDPLELLAVDGNANQVKGDGDAATWLPANKAFRCQYVARQIAVKIKYALWVTDAEKAAMKHVLQTCPEQTLPAASVQ